jgi:hypothetical protein
VSATVTNGPTQTMVGGWGDGFRNDWDSRDDGSAAESWHDANSAYCSDCGERWLKEQLTAGQCPDCVVEKNDLQWAGVLEVRRLRESGAGFMSWLKEQGR